MLRSSAAFDRRRFLQSLAVLGGGATLASLLPSWARAAGDPALVIKLLSAPRVSRDISVVT